LERYVEPVFHEIAPCPAGVPACVHMGAGHRSGLEIAYEAKAYPFVLQPDSIFSDGTIKRLQELASQGVQLALVPVLRFAEEPFFENLRKLGVLPRNRGGGAEPIKLNNRQLVHAALNSLHSETMTYEWDAPYFFGTPYAVWWRVPGEEGIVVHSMSWAPLLLDFTAVPKHDTSTFDGSTMDADYVHKNLGNVRKIHLALDSDEMFIASWAPLADKPYPLTPQPALQRPFIGDLTKKARFRNWFYGGSLDPFKQGIFFHGARWHAQALNDSWPPIERRALTTLLSCVAPPNDGLRIHSALLSQDQNSHALAARQTRGISLALLVIVSAASRIARVIHVASTSCANYKTIIRRLGQVIRGDPVAMRRAIWRVRGITHEIARRPFKEPEPNSPDEISAQH
jgi:hypothetical protein